MRSHNAKINDDVSFGTLLNKTPKPVYNILLRLVKHVPHPGFLPRGGGGGGGQGTPSSSTPKTFAFPKIWFEDNRKICITIDPPKKKIPGRKPATQKSIEILLSHSVLKLA